MGNLRAGKSSNKLLVSKTLLKFTFPPRHIFAEFFTVARELRDVVSQCIWERTHKHYCKLHYKPPSPAPPPCPVLSRLVFFRHVFLLICSFCARYAVCTCTHKHIRTLTGPVRGHAEPSCLDPHGRNSRFSAAPTERRLNFTEKIWGKGWRKVKQSRLIKTHQCVEDMADAG